MELKENVSRILEYDYYVSTTKYLVLSKTRSGSIVKLSFHHAFVDFSILEHERMHPPH